MNHKWTKDKCVKCGMTREFMDNRYYIYTRTGIITHLANSLPCIDWEKENKKTID